MASSKSSTSAVSASLSGTTRRGMMSNVRIEKEKDTKAENCTSFFPGTQRADGSWRKDVKVKSSYKPSEEQQKYVLSKLFKEEKKPIDNATAFFNNDNQVPEKSINLFYCRDNYDYGFVADRDNTGKRETKEKDLISWTEVPTAPKTTPSTGIETEAVHSAKPLIKREAKQKATTEPNPEQQPIPQEDLRKEKVASQGLKMPPISGVDAATLEELSLVWEALKDKEDRILQWNCAVRTWCWLKYECK